MTTDVGEVTPALLRLDPMFEPLRKDPCFQKLLVSCEPKEASQNRACWRKLYRVLRVIAGNPRKAVEIAYSLCAAAAP